MVLGLPTVSSLRLTVVVPLSAMATIHVAQLLPRLTVAHPGNECRCKSCSQSVVSNIHELLLYWPVQIVSTEKILFQLEFDAMCCLVVVVPLPFDSSPW
jgi:hypothetical protein